VAFAFQSKAVDAALPWSAAVASLGTISSRVMDWWQCAANNMATFLPS